jgi:hypothetical protein
MSRLSSSLPSSSPAMGALLLCAGLSACAQPDEDPPDARVAVTQSPDAAVPAATCPAASGQELVHQSDITTAETWAGDGTVHRVTFGITIRPGASLTLAPCAVVKVNARLQLTVRGTPEAPATLIAQGTAARPVLITSAVAGEPWGTWRGLTKESTFDLSYTTLENGGAGNGHGASLMASGDGAVGGAVVPVLRAHHLAIVGSAGTGLVLESGAAFTADSTELTVTGGGDENGDHAIELSPLAAGTLPALVISGNANDAIRVAGSLFISRDLTLRNRGVPYYFVFDRVRVTDPRDGATPTLTIEPGVELRFDDYLLVGYVNPGLSNQPGRLIAIGTPADPIIFTSSRSPRAAGDWPGIWLQNAPGSRLENVVIEYAGGGNSIVSSNCKPAGTSDDAALFVGSRDHSYIPAAGDLVAVHVRESLGHGINAMWQTSGAYAPDLTGGVSFTGIAGCRQTKNSTTMGCVGGPGCLVP